MQKQLTRVEADKERLMRTIETKNQLKITQDESHQQYIERLRAEQDQVIEDYERKIGEAQMEQEELRSITIRYFEE